MHKCLSHWWLDCMKGMGKLICECGKELGRITTVLLAPREEKAERKFPIMGTSLCDGMGNSRLSGAGWSLKPTYRIVPLILGPFRDLIQDVRTSILQTNRCMFRLALQRI